MIVKLDITHYKLALYSVLLPYIRLAVEKDRSLIIRSKLKFYKNYAELFDELIIAIEKDHTIVKNALRTHFIKQYDIVVNKDGVRYTMKYKGHVDTVYYDHYAIRAEVEEYLQSKLEIKDISLLRG